MGIAHACKNAGVLWDSLTSSRTSRCLVGFAYTFTNKFVSFGTRSYHEDAAGVCGTYLYHLEKVSVLQDLHMPLQTRLCSVRLAYTIKTNLVSCGNCLDLNEQACGAHLYILKISL